MNFRIHFMNINGKTGRDLEKNDPLFYLEFIKSSMKDVIKLN